MSLTNKYILSELSSPGKSKSFFYYSRDCRFIIKTIHHVEHRFLRRILKQYYNVSTRTWVGWEVFVLTCHIVIACMWQPKHALVPFLWIASHQVATWPQDSLYRHGQCFSSNQGSASRLWFEGVNIWKVYTWRTASNQSHDRAQRSKLDCTLTKASAWSWKEKPFYPAIGAWYRSECLGCFGMLPKVLIMLVVVVAVNRHEHYGLQHAGWHPWYGTWEWWRPWRPAFAHS